MIESGLSAGVFPYGTPNGDVGPSALVRCPIRLRSGQGLACGVFKNPPHFRARANIYWSYNGVVIGILKSFRGFSD